MQQTPYWCSAQTMASSSQPVASLVAVMTGVVHTVSKKLIVPLFGVKHEERTTLDAIVSTAMERVAARGFSQAKVESVTCFENREMIGNGTEIDLCRAKRRS